MANDIITTLHPDNDQDTNLYPNIKKENIPEGAVDETKLGDDVKDTLNGIDTRLANAIASISQPKYYAVLPTTDVGLIVYSDGYIYSWNGSAYTSTGIIYQASIGYDGIIEYLKKSKLLNDVDTSSKVSGYINIYGEISENANYSYIDNVTLKKGETIFIKQNIISGDASAIMVLAEYNTDYSVPRYRILYATGGDYIYTYTAPKDLKLSMTLLSSNDYECYILPNININIQDLLNGKLNYNTLKLESLYDNDFGELFTTSNNYFDKNNCFRARLDSTTGKMNGFERTDYCSNYISCEGKNVLYIWSAVTVGVEGLAVAFYDENYDYISGASWFYSINVPSTAKYVKVGFTEYMITEYNPMVMFDEPIRPTTFIEPFKRTLKNISFEYSMSKMFRTIGIIGDSLSSGEVYDENGVPKDMYNHSWLSTFCIKSGATPSYYSAGGMSTKGWLTSTYKTNFDNDSIKEAYFIALGTNDVSASYSIGNINDEAGSNSFVGYYKQIIETVHTKAPNAVIFMVSMYGNNSAEYQIPYSNMIKQIASLYTYCFFVDYANKCPDVVNLSISRIYTFYQENWHFTGAGYILVGETIYKLIDEIVNKNQSWFKFFVAKQ